MSKRPTTLLVYGGWIASMVLGFASPLFAQNAPATEPKAAEKNGAKPGAAPAEPRYCRIERDAQKNPVSLDTSIIRFTDKSGKQPGVVVDLIGAVHVGQKQYYDELNRRFATYDAVLYELVAPEGTRVPQGGRGKNDGNPVSSIQTGMKSLLELEFQLDCIDYTKPNMVHADLSPDEFAQNMKDRNDSFFQLALRMMGHGLVMQARDPSRSNDTQMLAAFFSKNRALQMRRAMASQFENLDDAMGAFEGENGSTLITERNKRALAVMSREIKAGKKRIAIFYGAGHLADMERRMIDEMGFQPQAAPQWISAWPLSEKPAPARP